MNPGIKIWPLPQRIRSSRDILMDTQSAIHPLTDSTHIQAHTAQDVKNRKKNI